MKRTEEYAQGVPSTAAIARHPIHPMLIVFPLAFLVTVFVTDLGYLWTTDPFWARVSLWLIGAGFATGALAALFGLIDFLTIKRARAHAAGWIHFLGNDTALGLALVNFLIRMNDAAAVVFPWGLALSAATVALLVVTGWYGGKLSYYYKIGVFGDEHKSATSMQHPSRTQEPNGHDLHAHR